MRVVTSNKDQAFPLVSPHVTHHVSRLNSQSLNDVNAIERFVLILLKKLKNADGSWAVRDDVIVSWKARDKKAGPLTVGWRASENEIGPEPIFGTIMDEKYNEPVHGLLSSRVWRSMISVSEQAAGERAGLFRQSHSVGSLKI